MPFSRTSPCLVYRLGMLVRLPGRLQKEESQGSLPVKLVVYGNAICTYGSALKMLLNTIIFIARLIWRKAVAFW